MLQFVLHFVYSWMEIPAAQVLVVYYLFIVVVYSCVGGVYALLPQLLHAAVDQAEQQMSPLPARMGRREIWQLAPPTITT